jgi:hypothetical protein
VLKKKVLIVKQFLVWSPIDSQLKPIMNVLKKEEIPFKETAIEKYSLCRKVFHFLTSSTFIFCIMIFLWFDLVGSFQ